MYSVRVATITGNNETSILKNCTILICTVNSSDTNFRQWANYVTGSWKTYLWAQANFEKTQLKIIIIFSNKVFSLQIWIKQLRYLHIKPSCYEISYQKLLPRRYGQFYQTDQCAQKVYVGFSRSGHIINKLCKQQSTVCV